MSDKDAIRELRERWLTRATAARAAYDVFMATSERGGKDSTGRYVYTLDRGGMILDPSGNPLIDQDCVAYRPEDAPLIAEAFVAWAQSQRLSFWTTQ